MVLVVWVVWCVDRWETDLWVFRVWLGMLVGGLEGKHWVNMRISLVGGRIDFNCVFEDG